MLISFLRYGCSNALFFMLDLFNVTFRRQKQWHGPLIGHHPISGLEFIVTIDSHYLLKCIWERLP